MFFNLDRSSTYNSSQSSFEDSVFNCSTSTDYNPGYLEVSSDHLRSSSCNNEVYINKISKNEYNGSINHKKEIFANQTNYVFNILNYYSTSYVIPT